VQLSQKNFQNCLHTTKKKESQDSPESKVGYPIHFQYNDTNNSQEKCEIISNLFWNEASPVQPPKPEVPRKLPQKQSKSQQELALTSIQTPRTDLQTDRSQIQAQEQGTQKKICDYSPNSQTFFKPVEVSKLPQ
jgi:N-acetylmuramoyl-L-alanine amidase CwlA